MIRLLDILSFLFDWGYVFVFFWIIRTFLPLRKIWPMRILALAFASPLAWSVIYANDLASLVGPLIGISVYITIFYGGRWTNKVAAILVFYPALIAVNYLMLDLSSRLFFSLTGAPGDRDLGWTDQQYFISTAIHTFTLLLRLLFWLGTWGILRKYLSQIKSDLTVQMWMLIDALMLAPFIAIFTILYFLPDGPAIVYPICGASIFSSFGCMYLASYICNSVQTAFRAQELEMKQSYLDDRLRDEERVRSIYHDMKNHLLILETQSEDSKEIKTSIQTLQEQIADYETYYQTGNDFLDIMIRDKSRVAKQKQIDFNAVVQFESGGFIEPLDISTIFGNALDNAIEASEKLPEQMRLITVKASRIRDMMVVAIENNMQLGELTGGKTSKEDSFLHGFGISNIESAVEKYDGQCSIQQANGKFILKIMIPVPS